MSSPTLKELYAQKVLQEALDPQKMQQMLQTIGTVENVIAPFRNKLPLMSKAIDQAKQLAAQKLSGEGGLWKKLAANVNDKFKLVDDIKNFITFQASMLQGLRSIPNVVSLVKKVGIDTSKESGASTDTLDALFRENPQNREQIEKVLQQAFTPPGGIFRSKKVPFVDDLGALVSEIFNLTPAEIERFGKQTGQVPGMPVSAQDAKQLMAAGPADAANQMASGAEKQTTGKDASGQSTGVSRTQKTAKGPAAADAGTPGVTAPAGAKKAPGLPDFETAMGAIGAKNLQDPANKKTVDAFRRFYDYLSKNAK